MKSPFTYTLYTIIFTWLAFSLFSKQSNQQQEVYLQEISQHYSSLLHCFPSVKIHQVNDNGSTYYKAAVGGTTTTEYTFTAQNLNRLEVKLVDYFNTDKNFAWTKHGLKKRTDQPQQSTHFWLMAHRYRK